jgi:pyruvate dehydrogenase E1 component alpha subunit
MVSWAVDGMDVTQVREATTRALEYVRDSGLPCFLELRTYRFRAHSMYDPDLYRDPAEVEQWKKADPLVALSEQLVRDGTVTGERIEQWKDEIDEEIAAAVAAAEAAPVEPVEDLTRYLVTEGVPAGSAR